MLNITPSACYVTPWYMAYYILVILKHHTFCQLQCTYVLPFSITGYIISSFFLPIILLYTQKRVLYVWSTTGPTLCNQKKNVLYSLSLGCLRTWITVSAADQLEGSNRFGVATVSSLQTSDYSCLLILWVLQVPSWSTVLWMRVGKPSLLSSILAF